MILCVPSPGDPCGLCSGTGCLLPLVVVFVGPGVTRKVGETEELVTRFSHDDVTLGLLLDPSLIVYPQYTPWFGIIVIPVAGVSPQPISANLPVPQAPYQ